MVGRVPLGQQTIHTMYQVGVCIRADLQDLVIVGYRLVRLVPLLAGLLISQPCTETLGSGLTPHHPSANSSIRTGIPGQPMHYNEGVLLQAAGHLNPNAVIADVNHLSAYFTARTRHVV